MSACFTNESVMVLLTNQSVSELSSVSLEAKIKRKIEITGIWKVTWSIKIYNVSDLCKISWKAFDMLLRWQIMSDFHTGSLIVM